jgi:hypothetical protein
MTFRFEHTIIIACLTFHACHFACASDRVTRGAANTTNAVIVTNDPALEARLHNEAPQAWAELEAFTRKLRGAYTRELVETGPTSSSNSTRNSSFTYRMNGPLLGTTEIHRGTEKVMAKNGDYAFRIGRRADQPNGRYAIDWLERIGEDEEADKRIRYQEAEACAVIFSAWKFFGKSLEEFEKIPGFVLKNVSSTDGFVRVEFDCRPRDTEFKHFHFTNAYAVLDPTNSWSLREYGADYREGDSKLRATLEYGESLNGFPIVKKKHEKIWADSGAYVAYAISQTFEFTEPTLETSPTAEFRLSHYNLPEPNFSTGARWWWLYYLVAGIACLLAAYVFWRRKYAAG